MLAAAEAKSFAALSELQPEAITKLMTAAVHAERGCRPPLHMCDIQLGKKHLSAVGNIERKSATKIIRLLQFISADLFADAECVIDTNSMQKKISKMVSKAAKLVELDSESLIEALVNGINAACEESATVLPANLREGPAQGQMVRGFRASVDVIEYTRSDLQFAATEVSADIYYDSTRPGYNAVHVKMQKAT